MCKELRIKLSFNMGESFTDVKDDFCEQIYRDIIGWIHKDGHTVTISGEGYGFMPSVMNGNWKLKEGNRTISQKELLGSP